MKRTTAHVEIDGGQVDDGGVLLRTALAMAAITQTSVTVANVRDRTKFPGLNTEDLTLLRALAKITEAELEGADQGSSRVTFAPSRRARNLNERVAIVTDQDGPGFANALVVGHTLLPLLARAGAYSTVELWGETYAHHNLSFDYYENVTLAALRRLGIYATARHEQAGFGWGSRGQVHLEVEPSVPEGLDASDRGALRSCRALVVSAELIRTIAERGREHLETLAADAKLAMEVDALEVVSATPGIFVTIWAEFERGWGGATAMGQRGVRIEAVAQRAFSEFMAWYRSDTACDPHLIDQLVLPAILSGETTLLTTSRITSRLLNTISTIKQFAPLHITVKGREGGPGAVAIQGTGVER